MIEYKTLYERVEYVVTRFNILCSTQELYDLVVNEYVDCGDNPEEATVHDIIEISDASNL